MNSLPAKCNRCYTRQVIREAEDIYKCLACSRSGPSPAEIGQPVRVIFRGSPQWEPRHIAKKIREER